MNKKSLFKYVSRLTLGMSLVASKPALAMDDNKEFGITSSVLSASSSSNSSSEEKPRAKPKKRERTDPDEGSDASSGEELPEFQSHKPTGPLDNPAYFSKAISSSLIDTSKSKEAFYIFNVGQGNAQLAIYDDFAVLYDCGTSTEYIREKVARVRFKNTEFQTFLKKSVTPVSLSKSIITPALISDYKTELKQSGESSGSLSHDSNEKTQKKATDVSNVHEIKEILKKSAIQNLFVFLSHSDKDHINLLSQAVPEDLKVLFALCGNFLTYTQNSVLLEEVESVLIFIRTRYLKEPHNTHLSLPYFWNHPKYDSLKGTILKDDFSSETLKAHLQPPGHVPPRIQGSLNKFLRNLTKFDSAFTQEQDRFKNVYLWLLNKMSREPNNTCPVISFRMPTLQQTLICTGDSETDIFGDITQNITSKHSEDGFKLEEYVQKKLGFSAERQKPYVISLMLPHHGALANLSYPMLNLFRPHALGISAGAGTMYPHPHFDLVKSYQDYYGSQNFLQERVQQFWEDFQVKKPFYYITYTGDKKENRKLHLGTLSPDKLPILCTNVLGTIKITVEGFLSFFRSIIEVDGKSYYLKVKNRLPGIEKGPGKNEITHKVQDESTASHSLIYKKSENNENVFIQKNTDDSTILFKIETEGEEAYYLGKKLDNVQEDKNEGL